MKHLYNDWDAVVGRAKGLWAPRWRTASVGVAAAAQASGTALTVRETKAADAVATADGGEAEAAAEARGGEAGGSGSLDGEGGEDEWGGRGSPTEVVVTNEDGVGGAGGAPATTDGGEETMVVQAGGGREEGQSKGRWHRGAWSTVDVRSVQSRLSRIVDDTSARIRSNIVKVCTRHRKTFRILPLVLLVENISYGRRALWGHRPTLQKLSAKSVP